MTGVSARGLFRATGKVSKPVAVRRLTDLAGDVEILDHLPREANDFYPTPPEPTRALLAAELPRLKSFGGVWEPAAGDGAMVREMLDLGLMVYASDLIDRGCGAEIQSFYDYHEAPLKAIVTNPPFAECNRDPGWVRHALDVLGVEYMALLLPINWLGAQGRAGLWAAYPPARVYVMRWRIDFTGQGAPPMLNAWFVWDRKSTGTTTLHMMDKADARQAVLL